MSPDQESPVVPSVGAVPVEVPEEGLWPPAESYHWRCAEGLLKLTRWDEWRSWGIGRQSAEITKLAEALSRVIPDGDVGRYVAEHVARVRAEERQRLADLILPHHWKTSQVWGGVRREACGRCSYGDGVQWLWPCPTRQALTGEAPPEPDSAIFAAGSAVLVATPQMVADAETLRDLAPADSVMGDAMCEIADRLDTAGVATPTKPGRQLRVMDAHRLEDCGDRAACWYVAHRAGLCTVVAEQDGQR